MMDQRTVTVQTARGDAPAYAPAPFHPGERYPEYRYPVTSSSRNMGYGMVRDLLHAMGLDANRFNTPEWNPLGEYIRPGQTVLLKPNLVSDRNWGVGGATDTESLVTHASIIRAVADYALIALRGDGSVIVGDCPVLAADWDALLRGTGLSEVGRFYQSFGEPVHLRDYRCARAVMGRRTVDHLVEMNQDERYIEVDLSGESLLAALGDGYRRFDVAAYDGSRTRRAHNDHRHSYLITRQALAADIVLNLPKLKTHTTAGISVALKNLVGIIGHKDYVPHYRRGGSGSGGDEYPGTTVRAAFYSVAVAAMNRTRSRLLRRLWYRTAALAWRMLSPDLRNAKLGNWQGNDTLWRSVLDINRIFYHYDLAAEAMTDLPRTRRGLIICDGLVGGDLWSPLSPSPVRSGVLVGGENPAALDYVCARIMGVDPAAIPLIRHAFDRFRYPLAGFRPSEIVVCRDGRSMGVDMFEGLHQGPSFRLAPGWAAATPGAAALACGPMAGMSRGATGETEPPPA